MAIETIGQAVKVTEASAISYTAIELDGTTSEYVREVRVSSRDGAGSDIVVFRLQVRSATREGIEFTTPPLSL